MNYCFEKFVDFKGIMSDEFDTIVASKKVYFFKFYQNYSEECNFFFSSNYRNIGVTFSLLMRQKSLWRI